MHRSGSTAVCSARKAATFQAASPRIRAIRKCPQTSGTARSRDTSARIRIDHKRHMEIAWNRQLAADASLARELELGPEGKVWQVRDLAHLDTIHDIAGGRLVVLCAFSRSCGSCKQALAFLQRMSRQAQSTRAGIVTCKVNVVDEFDNCSDVARWFKIRHVPSFLVFVDGALVDCYVLPDSRGRVRAPSPHMEEQLTWALQQVQGRVHKHLFRRAPGASAPALAKPVSPVGDSS